MDGLAGRGVDFLSEVGECIIEELGAVGPERRLALATLGDPRKVTTGGKRADEDVACRYACCPRG
jgi:hypothetical protein